MNTRPKTRNFPVVCVGGSAGGLDAKRWAAFTIAQKPDTAGQSDMPDSAIGSGCIDLVLSPEEIAKKIIAIAHEESAGV
jgi:two-component system, chemotaxis family, protein-glutamate methylesterase/glutaminase